MNTIAPTRNKELAPAQWPFRPTTKNEGDVVLSTIGRIHDRFCRCRMCKPSLIGETR